VQSTNLATPQTFGLSGSIGHGTPTIVWVQFKELFNAKYFPLCKKMKKVMNL